MKRTGCGLAQAVVVVEPAYIELIAYDTRTQKAMHIGTVNAEGLKAVKKAAK